MIATNKVRALVNSSTGSRLGYAYEDSTGGLTLCSEDDFTSRVTEDLIAEMQQEITYKESKKKPHHQFTSKSPWARRKKR